jgi:hypothetical protein
VKDNKKRTLISRILNHKGNLSGIRKRPLSSIHRERNPRILRISSTTPMVELKKINASTASRRDTTRGIVQTS